MFPSFFRRSAAGAPGADKDAPSLTKSVSERLDAESQMHGPLWKKGELRRHASLARATLLSGQDQKQPLPIGARRRSFGQLWAFGLSATLHAAARVRGGATGDPVL